MIAPERGKKTQQTEKKSRSENVIFQHIQDPTDNILIYISYIENKKDETEEFLR